LDSKELGCEPSPSAKSTPTAEPCFASTGQVCPSTKMCATCTPGIQGQLTLSAGAIRANPSAVPGSVEARKMTAISGLNIVGLSKNSGPLGCLERMLLGTSLWGSTQCFLTWKHLATKQGRLLFRLAPSAPLTNGNGYGFWRTPTAGDGTHNHCDAPAHKRGTVPLMLTVQALRSEGVKNGHLNPAWVEWLMGFTEGWTDLPHLAMPSSRKSRKFSV
jgi:hypothetical protein